MSKTQEKYRDSIIRRACEHVSLREIPNRKEIAEELYDATVGGPSKSPHDLPSWSIILRLVEAVQAYPMQPTGSKVTPNSMPLG